MTNNTMKHGKDWKQYALCAYDQMNSSRSKWGQDNDYDDAILRAFYMIVFSSGYDFTNYISLEAHKNVLEYTPGLNTDDHYFSPQFIGRLIMDTEVFLDDFNNFQSLFGECRKVIRLTKKENTKLRQLTENKRGDLSIDAPTHLKYSQCGIFLTDKIDGRKKSILEDMRHGEVHIPQYRFEDVIYVPEELKAYEKQYIVSNL